MSAFSREKHSALYTRLIALGILTLVLFPSLGYTSVVITHDLCGCSGDEEFACYCCMSKDSRTEENAPCFQHDCPSSRKGDPFSWLLGETALIAKGYQRGFYTRAEPIHISANLSLPIIHFTIEKPPA